MIEVQDLAVTFGSTEVLKDVSFRVDDGRVVVLVGANGSGKTTVFRSVAGALAPTSGRILVDGRPQTTGMDAVPVSYVSDRRIVWAMSVRWVLRNFGMMLGMSGAQAKERLDVVSDLLGMEGFLDATRTKLSTGQAAKFAIARMLMRPFGNVLLDEPSAGLDFDAVALVRREIRRLASDGAAVLLTSHRLDEIVEIADRIVVLRGGTIVADMAAEEVADDRHRIVRLVGGTEP